MDDPTMPEEQAQSQETTPATALPPGDDDQQNTPDSEDNTPLSKIEVEPAEDGGAVITHHKKMSDRVKALDTEETRPKKHVAKNHAELMKHLKKHAQRLKP